MSSKNKNPEKTVDAAQMTLNFRNTNDVAFDIAGSGTATIDWGDGTAGEKYTLTTYRDAIEQYWHVYRDKANYTVTITGENITFFECSKSKLVDLDVSGNTALTDLHLINCKITSLDVSKNLALKNLECLANRLKNLDVRHNTALTDLGCVENKLTCLDVSNNTALTVLDCAYNNLKSLDTSANTKLTKLICTGNELTKLDISENTALTELNCSYNELSTDTLNDLIKKLPDFEEVYMWEGFREEGKLNIDDNPGTDVCDLYIAKNKWWTMPKKMTMTVQGTGEVIIQMAGYDWMRIDWNDETGVTMDELSDDFSEYSHTYSEDTAHNITIGGENITHLYCGNNRITALDVSKYPALTELGCYENQITHLDVSKNTELTKLECWSNHLTTLDVSKNTELTELNCSNNPLESLNTGNNPELTVICDNDISRDKMRCPICNEKMVKIIYGLPGLELWELAKQRKAFIGGCCVFGGSPKYHCYNCQKSFSQDLKTSIDENDEWLHRFEPSANESDDKFQKDQIINRT